MKNFMLNSITGLAIATTLFGAGKLVSCEVYSNKLENEISEMIEENVQLHFDKYGEEGKLEILESELVDCTTNKNSKYDITIEYNGKTINYKKEGLFQKARAEVLNK